MLTAILILSIFNTFFVFCALAAIGGFNRRVDELSKTLTAAIKSAFNVRP